MTPPLVRESSDSESVFLKSLPVIDRVAACICRRNGLDGAEAEEFSAWVHEHLIDDDYRTLRLFQGRSALQTYLTTVVANLFRDYRNSHWGRWRPSAAARRLGPLAIRFETLVYRDGLAAREASETLRSQGFAETELRAIAARIPQRTRARETALDPAINVAAPDSADEGVASEEGKAESRKAEEAVKTAVAALPPEDQVVVKMRFWDDFSVADIARALKLDQKALYRRLDTIRDRLGTALGAAGLTREHVAEMLTRDREV